MAEDDGEDRTIKIKTGGSSTGLVIGGIVVIGITGVVGWYLYTGYKTEQDYIQAVKDYQNCIDEQLDAGATVEEAEAACAEYLNAANNLFYMMEHGWGYWLDKALTDVAIILGVGVGLYGIALTYRIVNSWLKRRGGSSGGGTPGEPYHDFYNETNWSTSYDMVDHCLFDYGTPAYDNPNMNALWTGVQAMPDWQRDMLAGFYETQGITDASTMLQTSWGGLTSQQQMILAGLIIAGLLLVCTVSLGAAVPVALPLAASAIAMV